MRKINVLVFPCGSEIGLEIHRSLKDIRFINLFGASSVRDHGAFVFENYIEGLPYINAPGFLEALKNIIRDNDIDVLFPALDDAIPYLAEVKDKLPCRVVESNLDTAKICRDKALTYGAMQDLWFNAKTYESWEEVDSYPVIIKPAIGQGSKGFKITHDQAELRFELDTRPDRQVICEFLPGDEYTIDCFTDRHGVLRYASQRIRKRTKAGISVNSYLEKPDELVWAIAKAINEKLIFRGMWFFQLKKNSSGEYRLLEIAPRVAGTMCLERAVGVNLPLLAVLDLMDYDVELMPQFELCEVDRALDCVFSVDCDYEAVYMDFDDTLVCENGVHLNTVAFLYQCSNEGVPVTLLTRHSRNIYKTLKERKIDASLFSNIVVLTSDEKKSDYIDMNCRPIFIDDSFAERSEVHHSLGIKVFGLDAMDVLLKAR